MSVYRRPARSDELYHWGKGSTSKNHKYIDKIGNRYFYTMEELRAFKEGATNKVKRGLHSFDKSRQDAINKIGGARDRVKRALARNRVKDVSRLKPVKTQQTDRAKDMSEREQKYHDYRVEQAKKQRQVISEKRTNRSRMMKEDQRSQQKGQTTTVVDRVGRNANLAGRNLQNAVTDAGNAVRKGYENDVRKPAENAKKRVTNTANRVKSAVEETANTARKNTNTARTNLYNTANAARDAITSGYENDVRKPVENAKKKASKTANKIRSNATEAGRNLVEAFTDARNAIARGYDEDIRKRRKRR